MNEIIYKCKICEAFYTKSHDPIENHRGTYEKEIPYYCKCGVWHEVCRACKKEQEEV